MNSNVIRKKTEVIMKVKMRKKIVREVKRMIQRKEMFSTTIWKVLMIWVLFKELLKAFIAKNVIKQLKVRKD